MPIIPLLHLKAKFDRYTGPCCILGLNLLHVHIKFDRYTRLNLLHIRAKLDRYTSLYSREATLIMLYTISFSLSADRDNLGRALSQSRCHNYFIIQTVG